MKISIVLKIVYEVIVRPVCKQVGYIVHCQQNVHELNGSCEHLGCEKERLEHQVDEARKTLQNIEGKVTKWLLEVSEFEYEFEKFKNDKGHTKLRFPHLWNRHRLGRRAKKMTMQVKNLVNESPKSDEVAYKENVTSNVVTLSNVGYMEFGSRNSTMNDILARLQDSTVKMIGLHGSGGVGKTTFVKEIAKKVRNKKLFDVVARVEITANPNLQKIQEDIAYVLGLRLERDGENVRADCLRRRLKKEKGNTLIILDDLWDKLDLNKLGIPLDDALDDDSYSKMNKSEERNNDYQDPEHKETNKVKQNPKHKAMKKEKPPNEYKGCKILLTSRHKNVLSDKMDVKSIFCIKELDDDDALMLFQKVVGISNEMSNFKQEIVKKYCEGIPMAIITVGRALRNKSESVWEARLEKLKKQELVGVQKPMEISLKMNYDHLENEELKSIFLLCAQMGHQPQIVDLVKYSFGLGILEGVYSLMEARDRVYTLIQKLVDSNLVVLDGSSSSQFNMHDMVRDAALSIAHKEKNIFTMRNGKVDDWLELEQCTSISICNSNIIDEFPNAINCPQLKFFRIDNDGPYLEMPEHFFEGMKKLRVLILSGFYLSNVRCLIKCLSNLRMLSLERCILDANLSIIGELKKLRIVSFSGSQIQNFPSELGCLDSLQSLDISNCYIKRMDLPFISKLTFLEELYIRKSSINFALVGEISQGEKLLLSELKYLHQLKVVDLSIPCGALFPDNLFFDNLSDYKIAIGDINVLSGGDFMMPNKYEPIRSLALQLETNNMETNNIHSLKGIKLLFKRVQNLLLGEIDGVKNDIYELNLDGFPDLKHLSITNNSSIEYLFKSMDSAPPIVVFPNLESLCLYKLQKIKMICLGPVPNASFTKLKIIKIKMCAHLKNVISFYMVKFLFSLETINVSYCDSLEEIVEMLEKSDKVEFPKLHSLTLQSLPPSFASFYSRVEGDMTPPLFGELVNISNLQTLNLSSINIHEIWCNQSLSSFCFQNLMKLVVKDCNKLRYLCSLYVASSLNKLKSLHVSGCHLMEKIFCIEGNGANKAFVFPKLEEIHLNEMSMLIDIWQVEISADSFCSLFSIHIENCKKLDKIFPSHIEGWYESLENLKVIDCPLVEVIFEIKDSQQRDASGGIDTNLQSVFLEGLPTLKQVWSIDPNGILNFKKLQSINISYCKKLRNVFPASAAKDVQNIEYMSVTNCDRMVEIVACEDGLEASNEPLVFPELSHMKLCYLKNMKCFCMGRHVIKCPKLTKLTIVYCEKLEILHTIRSQSSNEEISYFSIPKKVFSNLEYMEIGFEEANNWLRSDTDNYIMYRLKELIIFGNYKDNKIDLYQFLYRMPNLEKLSLSELAPSANITKQQALETVLQLKELVLSEAKIDDIGFERNPVLRRLELLSLKSCYTLTILAPSSVSLTYLTYLEVKDCGGLRNLMASSTAKSLVQLKTMKVIHCWKIKEIVIGEGDEEDNKVTEILFSKLITIELVNLEQLTSFCSNKNCIFKFPSLEILIARECLMMETFSKNLASAPKLENIFAVEGDGEAKWQWQHDLNATIQKVFNDKASFRYSEYLNLSDYPRILIEQLWLPPCAMLQNNFGNLKRLTVWGCDSLRQVIPSHLLACFENLEELKVYHCSKTEIIFNITDEMREQQRKTVGMIRLKRLILWDLRKLEHVWDKDPEGIIVLSCLRSLELTELPRLKHLYGGVERGECDGEEQLLIQIQKVFSNLEYMEIDFKEASNWLWSDTDNYKMYRLKELIIHGYRQETDLYQFLYRMPNLEKLSLPKLALSANITEQQGLKTVLKLKELVVSSSEIDNIGFERNPVLRRLELLSLKDCNNLTILAPSSVSLTYLTYLKVKDCGGLEYLMASSTAKSLVQLKTMKVINCWKIKEIMIGEGDEEDNKVTEILFSKLITIKFVKLKELTSFCSNKNCIFKFPSLEILIVRECFMMETFSKNLASAPKLENIFAVEEDGEAKWQWQHDLNATIQKVFNDKASFRYLEYLNLSDYPGLIEQLWLPPGPMLQNNFGNLKRLKAWGCDSLRQVIPSHLLACFENLEELDVSWCRETEVIFNITDEIREQQQRKTLGIIRLKILILRELPKLEHVWDKDPEGIIELQVLRVMSVERCDCLRSLFPAMVAKKDLTLRLEKLEVTKCSELVEIFSKGEEEKEEATKKLVLSCLRSLTLRKLRKLKYSYLGVERGECDGEEQLLIQIQKEVMEIPCLKKMSLDIGDMQVTWDRDMQVTWDRDSAEGLLFESVTDMEELLYNTGPLNRFLHMFPNIKKFAFARCGKLTKLVPSGCTAYFSNLIYLEVTNCNSLVYLCISSTAKSLGRLKRLEITECQSLKEIVAAKNESDDEDKEIIFEQLQVLYLKRLDKLRWFYFGNCTLHFPRLKEVYLIDCNRMGSFSRHNRIDNSTKCYTEKYATPQQCSSDLNSTVQNIFEKKFSMSKHRLTVGSVYELEIVQGNILHSLKVLTFLNFDGSDIFPYGFLKQMPDMEKLEVRKSPFKEIFCLQNPNIDEFLSQLKELSLDSLPNLVSIGFENLVPSIASFSNLMDLKVSYCNELLYLFTYSTAKSLGQLKTIQIKWCNSIKEIVVCDKEGGESNEDEIIFPHLKCLTVVYLPKLRSFYEGSVNFPSLDELMIRGCDIKESLCGGTIKTEKLSKVELDGIDIPLETDDLNSTLMNAFLEKTSDLNIGNKPSYLDIENKPKLQQIWLGLVSIPNTCFGNLISLIVDSCQFLSDAVLHSHLLPLFTKLEELQVRNCDYVKTIFDVKCVKQDTKIPLNKLTLSKLPNLENVWNKDPQGLLKMQPLCEVEVDNCKRLTNVFPASVANDIEKLENLVLKHCEEFMTIVAKDDAYQRETFSYVKSLTLCDLPKFKYYDTCFIHDATTSKLEHLTLGDNELKKILHEEFSENLLPKLKVFALLFQHKSGELVQQVSKVEKLVVCDDSFKEIFDHSELKVLRWKSLKELVSVGSENSWIESFLIKNIESFEVISCFSSTSLVSCTVSFSDLTHLEVNRCKGLIYLFTSSTAKRLVQLETMEIIDCDSIEEIIVCNKEGDESAEEEIIFPHLKYLTLNGLPKLISFYKGSLGFPSLDQLKVTACNMLKYLLTSSTAKSLVQLKIMEIKRCDSIEEIIVCDKEGDESTEDEIIFPHLNCLTLNGLPKLISFYKGSLGFPLLDQLKVTNCAILKYLLTSSTAKSLVQLKTMEIEWCDSIKEIIVCNKEGDESNENEIIFMHLTSLTLRWLPKLRRFYKGSLSFPSLDKHNLKVYYCDRMKTDLNSLVRKA